MKQEMINGFKEYLNRLKQEYDTCESVKEKEKISKKIKECEELIKDLSGGKSMERKLKSYMGFEITKYTTKEYTKWVAENADGYVYESKNSLADLKKRIYLDDQSKKLGAYLGKALGIRR